MNDIRRVSFASTGLFALLAILVATPSFAEEGVCLQWDASGTWDITQSNGTRVKMKLQQTGTQLEGVASYSSYDSDAGRTDTIGGPVDGTFSDGKYMHATVYWSNSTAGYYRGTIAADGTMSGFSNEVGDYTNNATFRASGFPRCLAREAVAPPPASAPPARALGRVQSTGAPAPSMTICEAAKSARARNSPAAPGLEKQCAEQPVAQPAAQPAKPAAPVIDEAWRAEKSARGETLVDQDAMALALRSQWSNAEKVRAFNMGMAVAEGHTAPGPGKQAIHDALAEGERRAFQMAVWYSIDRNANAELAAKGAEIAEADPTVAEARKAMSDPFYWLGFDIATGLFGDPALGAKGNTAKGPGSTKIRDGLNPESAREGFDEAVQFHLARNYKP